MSALVPLLLFGASLGAGALILRLCGVLALLPARERAPWSFTMGFGTIGWLIFLPAAAQMLSPPVLVAVLIPFLGGLYLLRDAWDTPRRPTPLVLGLLAVLATTAGLDILQALAPLGDADSSAYHFALPKLFLSHGGLVFQARAVEGAIPMLSHMTYTAALGLGGERATEMWLMLSGWASTWLVWAIGRRWLPPAWALALALAWKTTPSVIYAAGTGQVEVRTALFATVAVFALAEAIVSGRLRWLVVAGLATGFFVGSKYPGLVLCGSGGLIVLLLARRRWVGAATFGICAAVVGCQWYGWNWWNTGDPLFPLLWSVLPHKTETLWSPQAAELLARFFSSLERPLPHNPLWLVLYPFLATFDPLPVFEAGRTGLGVLPVILLPFAAAYAWSIRRCRTPLGLAVLTITLTYTVWFLFGPSQRVRHLLPLLPTALIALTVGAARIQVGRQAMVAGFTAVLLLQMGASGLFAVKFARALGEDPDRVLADTLPGYKVTRWINDTLPADAKIFNTVRWLNYYLDRPYFYGHPLYQNQIQVSDGVVAPQRFWHQLRAQKITHLLYVPYSADTVIGPGAEGTSALTRPLIAAGCAIEVHTATVRREESRTLPGLHSSTMNMTVVELLPQDCPLEHDRQ